MFYDLLFDKSFSEVNRFIRDSHPYQIINGNGKDIVVINALGVDEDDIKIEIKADKYNSDSNYLYIEGSTENETTGTTYSFKNRFGINKLKVKEIKYYTKDGLLYIEIQYVEEPTVEIPISKKEQLETETSM